MVKRELMILRAKKEAADLFQKEQIEQQRLAREKEDEILRQKATESAERQIDWVVESLRTNYKTMDHDEFFNSYLKRGRYVASYFRKILGLELITEDELLQRAGITRSQLVPSLTNTPTLHSEDADAR